MSSISSPYNCVGTRNAPGKATSAVLSWSPPLFRPTPMRPYFSPRVPALHRCVPGGYGSFNCACEAYISFSVDPAGSFAVRACYMLFVLLPVTQSGKNRLHPGRCLRRKTEISCTLHRACSGTVSSAPPIQTCMPPISMLSHCGSNSSNGIRCIRAEVSQQGNQYPVSIVALTGGRWTQFGTHVSLRLTMATLPSALYNQGVSTQDGTPPLRI
jgi:hypothetical protein